MNFKISVFWPNPCPARAPLRVTRRTIHRVVSARGFSARLRGAQLLEACREARAGPEPRGDAQLAPVAVEDVLDDGQAEPGAPLLPAGGGVHPVEALGEARQMLRPDA